MRELKFRIWDNDKNEWLAESDDNALTYYGFHLIGEVMTVQSPTKWRVNGVVEQYTGLKDKNGKEIYEGDIVEYDWYIIGDKPAYRTKEQVVFDDMGARLGNDRIRNCTNVEVIGNIHENPELLEEE